MTWRAYARWRGIQGGGSRRDQRGIRIELYRPGLSALSDERDYKIVDPPKPKEEDRKAGFPRFKVIPVDGPQEGDWDLRLRRYR